MTNDVYQTLALECCVYLQMKSTNVLVAKSCGYYFSWCLWVWCLFL